jgi:hypothetical protein
MGIKGLNSWICSTFPGVMQPVPKDGKGGGSGPTPYSHVLFDANGIVHQACRKRPSEREVIRTIVFELDSLLRAYPPRISVLIALDGPGPTAKLLEQRKRRIDRVLKAARDTEAAIPGSAEALRREELARLEGRPPPSQKKARRKGFDSLQVGGLAHTCHADAHMLPPPVRRLSLHSPFLYSWTDCYIRPAVTSKPFAPPGVCTFASVLDASHLRSERVQCPPPPTPLRHLSTCPPSFPVR